ncbi:MAG: HDOD domain-containing protein [Desulfobacterales bacterium]|jgi:HD-GYP domain-containing protein (c-di-GMP phosphodiesterase class II)|nr:HDOD domain-containing protein [Desulfobacterales bacterium]
MSEDTFASLCAAERDHLLEIAAMMLAAMGEKDPPLRQHSERVANACANFCRSAGNSTDEDLFYLYLAGLLHDAGLIAAPNDCLERNRPLSAGDLQQIKKHPVAGVRILSTVHQFEPLLAAVRHHHESWDGSGYPDGKRGEEIPLAARVIRLVDAFDELTSTYRRPQGLSSGEALAAIEERAGTDFDPGLLPAFKSFVGSTPALGADFMLRQQSDILKQQLPAIVQKFSTGKILPPAMPQVVFELRRAIHRKDATVRDLAQIIEKDPVVSLRLISIANSPVYKGYGEIPSVQAAIPRLGFKETLSIVVAIANKNMYEAKPPRLKAALDRMWGHSLATAYASRLFAQALALEEPETLFLMGLTHDVGKVVLLRAFAEVTRANQLPIDSVLKAVQEAHQPIGIMLLKRWGFGEEFQEAVSLSAGASLTAQTSKKTLVVHLSKMLARKLGYSSMEWDGGDLAALASARLLGLSTAAIAPVEDKVKAMITDIAHLF